MRPNDVKRLVKQFLLPHMPGLRLHKKLLYFDPIEYLLRGKYFDSSGYERWFFYVQVFVIPLFTPSDVMYFYFGERLGKASRKASGGWPINAQTESQVMGEILSLIKSEAIPFLRKFKSPGDFARIY